MYDYQLQNLKETFFVYYIIETIYLIWLFSFILPLKQKKTMKQFS